MDQLGAALRGWRDRLDPAVIGLVRHAPRRVPGLRREELAVLSGISVEYVVRLEQGRAPTPSAEVCSALARALRLTGDEQAHLLRLAGHAADPDRISRIVPGSLYRIMDQLAAHPLAVYDAAWSLLHWNPLHAAVFGDPTDRGPEQRNVLISQFTGTMSRIRQTPQERDSFEESLVADLRATTSRFPDDPAVRSLLTRLRSSARFRDLWARRSVAEHQSASKIVAHPAVGDIALDCDVLTTQGVGLHLVVCTARPGTDAGSKLGLLNAIGVQEMSSSG